MIWNEILQIGEHRGNTIYIVGGYLRDLFLSRESHDLDLVVETAALDTARMLANRLWGTFVLLDAQRGVGRVVCSHGSLKEIDVAQLQATSLEQDLRARDLTINSLALPINEQTVTHLTTLEGCPVGSQEWLAARATLRPSLIDPSGGLRDLEAGLLRTNSLETLQQDPLRVLRVIRFLTALSFALDAQTRDWLTVAASGLINVSAERIRDEVFSIFSSPQSVKGMELAAHLGILPNFWPEAETMKSTKQNHHHTVDVWVHCLTALGCLEQLFRQPDLIPKDVRAPLVARLEQPFGRTGRTYGQLLKWVALFHDVGKPVARGVREDGRITFYGHDKAGSHLIQQMASRLALSNKEAQWAEKMVAMHMRPLMLFSAKGAGSQARYRVFRDLGDVALEALLLSLADMEAKMRFSAEREEQLPYRNFIFDLCREFLAKPEALFPQPLIGGRDIIEYCPDIPQNAIGQLLKELADKQGAGTITSREQALAWCISRANMLRR